MSRKNRLKAGTLLAGTIASAAVGAQQSSAGSWTWSGLWNGTKEGVKSTYNFAMNTIPDNLKEHVGEKGLFKIIAAIGTIKACTTAVKAIKNAIQSYEKTKEIADAVAEGFENYAIPGIKYIGEKMLGLAVEHPFIFGTAALATYSIYSNKYKKSILKNATKEELEKSENPSLADIKKAVKEKVEEEAWNKGYNEALEDVKKSFKTDSEVLRSGFKTRHYLFRLNKKK